MQLIILSAFYNFVCYKERKYLIVLSLYYVNSYFFLLLIHLITLLGMFYSDVNYNMQEHASQVFVLFCCATYCWSTFNNPPPCEDSIGLELYYKCI